MKRIKVNRVRLEASSACQLRCPVCPTGQGETKVNVCRTGFLRFDDFRKFLDLNGSIKEIELSNWGEVFLNPDLPAIIEYAYRSNVRITISNGANLNHVTNDSLKALVKYGVKELVIALDGASHETYSTYRIGGNFDNVIDNINAINDLKKKYRSEYPSLIWQYIVFGHNENDITEARALAKSLNMEFSPKLNAVPDYSPVRDVAKVLQETNMKSTRVQDDWGTSICNQLWLSPQINWDGTILGCCHNSWATFGLNAFENNLDQCVNSEAMIYAREMLKGEVSSRVDIPCTTCEFFMQRSRNKNWVNVHRIWLSGALIKHSFLRKIVRTIQRRIHAQHA